MQKLSSVAALKTGATDGGTRDNISLKDVLIKTEIKDGRMYVEPFELNVKGQKVESFRVTHVVEEGPRRGFSFIG